MFLQAWRQDRLDLAELMLPKLRFDSDTLDPSAAESVADLYYEIGSDQIGRSRSEEALRWLTRAHDVLSVQGVDGLSSDAPELQVSIMHAMVKTFISLGGETHVIKAWNVIAELDSAYGKRLAVMLLKLDIYALDPSFPPQEYCDVLERIVRTVHLTDSNVNTALHHIHKLRIRNARMAHKVLVDFAMNRLVGTQEPRWLEKTLVTIVWNCTTSAEFEDSFDPLSNFLDTLYSNNEIVMSPSATHAAQIVRFSVASVTSHQLIR